MQKNMLTPQTDTRQTTAELAKGLTGAGAVGRAFAVDKRRSPRFKVVKRLLAVCDFFAGQILDISRTGLSFELLHLLPSIAGNIQPAGTPRQSDKLDILSAGFDGYLLRNVSVRSVFDLRIGRKYADNDGIVVYRRGLRLKEPLTEEQFSRLWRYFDGEQLTAAGRRT